MNLVSPLKSPGKRRDISRGEVRPSVFPTGFMLPFMLTTLIFFFWGMSNNLTDILVQQFRKSFSLSLLQAQLTQTSVFLAYGTMAIPSAILMRRFGYKAGLLCGLVVFGIGTLLFWPAALIGRYIPFLVALFIVGTGSSILETAANPLIAQFGDPSTSEQRLNFAQAFNPPGTITGVLLGTWFIFSGIEKTPAQIAAMQSDGTYSLYLHQEILRVVPTYIALGFAVLILAAAISRIRFPANLDTGTTQSELTSLSTGKQQGAYARLLRNPLLLSAVITQFFYVGSQISTWSTLIPYMRAYTDVSERTAGYLLTATLVALAVGRIVSTSIMRFIPARHMMGWYAIINVGLLAIGISEHGMAGTYAILATSFFMSIMYPTIFALGVKDLGEDTKLGSSLIVMSIVGGAIFPPAVGWITRMTGSIALGYILPALGYIVVSTYAFLGPRLGNRAAATVTRAIL